MKILVFSTLYPNEHQVQHGVFVENGLRHLRDRHTIDVQVCAPVPWFPLTSSIFGQYSTFAKISRIEIRDGVTVHHPRYPVIPKVGMGIAPQLLARTMLPILKAYIKNGFDFDIIDAHFCYPDGLAAIWLGEQLNKPVVVSALGSDINSYRYIDSANKQLKKGLPKASAITTVCQALSDAIIDMGIKPKEIVVLRNGVDLALFKPCVNREQLREEQHIQHRQLIIIGNLVDVKQHHLLIKTMAILKDYHLKIIGDGDLRNALELQVEQLGLTNNVVFLGRLKQIDMIPHLQTADALVLCSKNEGWANVLLEAMACGTPVVATAVGGTPEVITDESCGIIIDEHTPAALAQGITTLFATNPERQKVRTYAEKFSWEETSDNKFNLFKKIISQRKK